MTLPELREHLGSLPSAGYMTSDSRFDPGFLDSSIHNARAFVVTERWKQDRKVPPVYYQTYEPVYDKAAQDTDECYTVFYGVPDIIALDGRATGLGYVGTLNGTPTTFREVSSQAAFASMQTDRLMKFGRFTYVLIGKNTVKVFAESKIKRFTMDAVFADPTLLPSYNIIRDQYPIDVSDIPKIETYLLQGAMGLTYKTPMDRVADSKDITVPPNI